MSFITISRKILDWEWYGDPIMTTIFVHCLIKANYCDKNWKGETIKRGSFITSKSKLSEELNMSRTTVISALKKLEKTGEINCKTTNKWTLVNVSNYNAYQPDVQEMDNKVYNKVYNKLYNKVYTTNNINNINNINKTTTTGALQNLKNEYLSNENLVTAFCTNQSITKEQLEVYLDQFTRNLESVGEFDKEFNDYTTHFLAWFRKRSSAEKNKPKRNRTII